MLRLTIKDFGLALSVPVIWGMGFTFAKAGLNEFPPLFLMSLRFSLSALILCWFYPPPIEQFKVIFLLALVSATIQYGLTFTGLKGLDASTAVLLVQLEVPFGALLASIILKDNLGWIRALGMVLVFSGVGLITGTPSIHNQFFSAFLVVCGAFTWALGQIMIKKMILITGFQLIAWLSFFAGPQMFIASLLIEHGQLESVKNATIVGWGTVIYLGVIMTTVGYGIWYQILKKYDVNQVMPFLLLVPVSSIAGAVLFLGERPGVMTMIGGTIVIFGVAIIVFAGQRLASME
ncbi:MAG: EamA family transporter [Desulfobacula sp.]|jgi:O-acetylserine/cysteine efflux transporter|uniref:DMT family transporter n=1 Tax=Desulfobacula sp. TaxID=2593537 RepID=UPI001D7C69B4|nr:EamA family transporter [Desulfobacula sp.]MBT3483700.1 EamA family transporter [Desulfobacula sp.]MBT3803525.1 EamA family transporter [Desulfobacula sp.]MBT4023320.1 EamA family transporter [Desulfobacula sp.]MBT4197305.1 EamA family transporter [Desulfobacula sp.]